MRLWKKKLKPKKIEDTGWSILTKVSQAPEEILVKSRKNQKPWTYYAGKVITWLRDYFRAVGWVFFGGVILVGIFVLSATPIFSLKPDRIEVVLKPEPVFDKGAVTSLLRDFSGRNIFSITTKEIFEALSENIRHIASVEKTLLMPDGMRITVTSFPASYRAFIGEEKFLLTENGQLINDIPEVEVPALQIYHLVQDPDVGKNTPIMDEDMYAIRIILNSWRDAMTEFPINELKFYEQEKELHIVTKGTHCIFSLENGGIEVSLMKKLISEGKVVLSHLVYIDMRIPNRIYTCATSESPCTLNLKSIYGN